MLDHEPEGDNYSHKCHVIILGVAGKGIRAAPSYLCSNSMAWYPARGSRLSSSVIRKMYSECQKRGVQGVSKKAENKE